MNFKMDKDPFSKNAQGISKFYHEVLSLLKLLQTEPLVKNVNVNYSDLYYTVVKNRDDKGIVDNKIENNEKAYFIYEVFIIPNHYI